MKLISLIFILIFSLSVFGQTKRPPTKSTESTFQTKPFNSKIENLSPHFLGHNARILLPNFFSFALEIIKGCGKFETSTECQSRLNSIYDRKISKDLTARDLLAFSIPINCDYSADRERISCSNFLQTYTWSNKVISSGNYVGQNVFGVKK